MAVNVKFDRKSTKQILQERGLNDDGKVQKYIDSEVIRLMAPYTPKMEGTLIDSATKLSDIGSGLIEQAGGELAPYGKKWYYTEANFTGAPMRGTHWFERMKNDGGKKSILDGVRRLIK